MSQISQYTELDAINEILSSIGSSPINTLEELTDVDAINARNILNSVNRKFQARGWSFNYIEKYTFNPDVYSKKVLWNNDILYIEGNNGEKFVKRDGYMYDLINSTSTFSSSFTADVVMLVPFEELPDSARAYVIAKSCMQFATRFLGDTTLIEVLLKETQEAWSIFHEYEMDNNDYNMLDNIAVQEVKGY